MCRLANVSDSSSTNFHPCTEGSNQTVPTFFSEDSYTCNDQFMRLFEDPDVVLEAKNGSYLIIVGATICVSVFSSLQQHLGVFVLDKKSARGSPPPCVPAVHDKRGENYPTGWIYEGACTASAANQS